MKQNIINTNSKSNPFQEKTRDFITNLTRGYPKSYVDKYMSQFAYNVHQNGWSWDIIYETLLFLYTGDNKEEFSEDIGVVWLVNKNYDKIQIDHDENLKFKENIHSYFTTDEGIDLSKRLQCDIPDVVINFDDDVQEKILEERHKQIMEKLIGPEIDFDKYVQDMVEKGEL